MHSSLFQDVYPWAGKTRADRSFQGQKKGNREGYLMSYASYRQIGPDLAAESVPPSGWEPQARAAALGPGR